MADDDEYDDSADLLRELLAASQAQEELILTLVRVIAEQSAQMGDPTRALQNLPGLTARRLASKYRIAQFLSDEDTNAKIHADRSDALEDLLLKLDPDNLGDWQ